MINIIDNLINKEDKFIFKLFAKYSGEKKIRKYLINMDWNYITNNLNYTDGHSHTALIDYLNYKLPYENIISYNDFDEYVINNIFNKTKEQLLINYLIDNNLYSQFVINLKDKPLFSRLRTFNDITSNIKSIQLFQSTFHWRDTPQGYDFWKNINNKWINYIKQNINNKANSIQYKII